LSVNPGVGHAWSVSHQCGTIPILR
jgi:hypothetical protein